MAFAALNLLLCSLRRVKPLARLALRPQKVQTIEAIKKMPFYRAVKLPPADLGDGGIAGAAAALQTLGYQVSVVEGPAGKNIYGELGSSGYYGSLLTHFGLLVILLRARVGSLTCFEHAGGGIAGDSFQVPEGNFTVRIDSVCMVQEPDPTVRPRVYSDLVITRDGWQIAAGTVAINEPLRFQGNTIYHKTFRYVSEIVIKNPATGEEIRKQVSEQDLLYVDGAGSYIHFLKFFLYFSMRGQPMSSSMHWLAESDVYEGMVYFFLEQCVRPVLLQLD